MSEGTVRVGAGLSEGPQAVAMLVQLAGNYESKIYLKHADKKINAKSIMGVMTLDFAEGGEITVTAEGADEAKAVHDITKYLRDGAL